MRKDPTTTYMNVTPARAKAWLNANTNNRRIRWGAVDAMTRDIENGRWRNIGEPIKFATDGTILDGQHRLWAIANGTTTVRCLIIEGLPPETQKVMDTGRARTFADQLAIAGHKNCTLLGSVIRWSAHMDKGGAYQKLKGGYTEFTKSELWEHFNENPTIETAVSEAINYRSSLQVSPTAFTYAWWLISETNDYDTLVEFFASIRDNATTGVGDPRLALMRRIGSSINNGQKLSIYAQVSLIVRAWNAWRLRKRMVTLPVENSAGKVIPIPRPI